MENEIWRWFGDEFKAYCADNKDYRKIMTWKGTRHGSTYYFPDGEIRHDVIIPYELFNRTAELLGLSERVPDRARRRFPRS